MQAVKYLLISFSYGFLLFFLPMMLFDPVIYFVINRPIGLHVIDNIIFDQIIFDRVIPEAIQLGIGGALIFGILNILGIFKVVHIGNEK